MLRKIRGFVFVVAFCYSFLMSYTLAVGILMLVMGMMPFWVLWIPVTTTTVSTTIVVLFFLFDHEFVISLFK